VQHKREVRLDSLKLIEEAEITARALGLTHIASDQTTIDLNEESKSFQMPGLIPKKTLVVGPNLDNEYYAPAGLNRFSQKLTKNDYETLKLSIPALNKPDAALKKKQQEAFASDQKDQTKKLVENMIEAVLEDHKTIQSKRGPALHRIMLLKEMDQMLRKRNIQMEFLQLGGLEILANWIDQNPDGSFPLPQVVESVFQILDHFPMTSECIEQSSIAKVV
jgi:hypothetical protein